MTKTDAQLRSDIEAELRWDPAVASEAIGVAAKDGVVGLSGTVETFAQKQAAQQAVQRVAGVRALTNAIEVRLAPGHVRGDTEIAQAVADALRWHSLVPDDQVLAQVEDGWVTLTGEVDWAYQLASAEQCVHPLVGVRGVNNRITIRQQVHSGDIARQIEAALARHAQREARRISVAVEGPVVTLTGHVGTLAEHDAAVGTAYATRGVTHVVDHLEVTP